MILTGKQLWIPSNICPCWIRWDPAVLHLLCFTDKVTQTVSHRQHRRCMPNSICCHFRGDTPAMFCAIMIIKLPLQQMGNGICAFPLQCCDSFPWLLPRVSSVSLKSAIWVRCCSFARSSHPSGGHERHSETARRRPALGAWPPTSNLTKNPTRLMDFKSQEMGKEIDYVLGSESSHYKLQGWKACSVVRSTHSWGGDSTLGVSRAGLLSHQVNYYAHKCLKTMFINIWVWLTCRL